MSVKQKLLQIGAIFWNIPKKLLKMDAIQDTPAK